MAEFTEVIKQKERMCESIKWSDCGLSIDNNGKLQTCNQLLTGLPQEAEKVIMDWAKEHPLITNADKFEEVLGIKVRKGDKGCNSISCPENQHGCDGCQYNGFWDQEYREPNQ